MTRLLTEQNEALLAEKEELTQKMVDFERRCQEAEAAATQAKYEQEQAMQEVTPLKEQLELRDVEVEELTVKLEIRDLEIEELQEKLTEALEAEAEELDNAKYQEVLKTNAELQKQLAQMAQIGQELLDSKDKHINSLATERSYVDSLGARYCNDCSILISYFLYFDNLNFRGFPLIFE